MIRRILPQIASVSCICAACGRGVPLVLLAYVAALGCDGGGFQEKLSGLTPAADRLGYGFSDAPRGRIPWAVRRRPTIEGLKAAGMAGAYRLVGRCIQAPSSPIEIEHQARSSGRAVVVGHCVVYAEGDKQRPKLEKLRAHP